VHVLGTQRFEGKWLELDFDAFVAAEIALASQKQKKKS